MIKRWDALHKYMVEMRADIDTPGYYVLYSDYLLLKAALKEALEGWQNLSDKVHQEQMSWDQQEAQEQLATTRLSSDRHIKELRAQFLTDK